MINVSRPDPPQGALLPPHRSSPESQYLAQQHAEASCGHHASSSQSRPTRGKAWHARCNRRPIDAQPLLCSSCALHGHSSGVICCKGGAATALHACCPVLLNEQSTWTLAQALSIPSDTCVCKHPAAQLHAWTTSDPTSQQYHTHNHHHHRPCTNNTANCV